MRYRKALIREARLFMGQRAALCRTALSFSFKGNCNLHINGNVLIFEASLYPSGHSSFFGVPNSSTTLFMVSTSLLPGNKGVNVYSSMIMHGKAKISTGKL